jgi:ABC-type dipeptide/oligopeptide/nickel transport system permease component
MTRYALRRIAWTVPVLFLVVTLLFCMLQAIGGDPLRPGKLQGLSNSQGWVKRGDPKPDSIAANQRRNLGLDRPWLDRYGAFLRSVATFDFGETYTFRQRTVNEVIRKQAPISIELGLLALGWAIVIGGALGIAAALRSGSALDGGARVFASLAAALPAFFVGALAIQVFAVKLGYLPTSGWDGWRSKILPSIVLGLVPAAYIARMLRAGMLETLGREHVAAARAKGIRRHRIVSMHVVPNAVIPLLAALGPLVGYLVTGSFVIEQVFAIPGIGRYFVAAVLARDYPLVLGLTIVLTLAVVLANLVVDLVQAALDPRVRERVVMAG